MPQDANEQKYATEHALLQVSDGCGIFSCNALYAMTPQNIGKHYYYNSHIYFIGQNSKIRFLQADRITNDIFRIIYEVDGEKKCKKRIGTSDLSGCSDEISSIETKDEGKSVQILKKDGTIYRESSFYTLLQFTENPPPEFLNVKTLYIGQAFGDGEGKKKRTAIERLKAHSTLQEIIIKESERSWLNTQLLFFTFTLPYRLILKMDGRGQPLVTGDEDSAHTKSIFENPLTEKQRISIIEASLIRYFQPYYNTHYVHEYPTPENKHLTDAYRYDYNAIITEIDTEDIRINLFSDIIKPASHHIAQFDLYSIEERKSFFNYKQ